MPLKGGNDRANRRFKFHKRSQLGDASRVLIERTYLSALSGVAVGIAYVPGRLTNNGHVTTDYDQVIRRSSCICIRQGCVGTTRTLKPYVPLSEAGTAPW